jgi:hypothetical protein
VSAFVGTAAAPMISELPFDLIVMGRTYPPIPPSPTLYRLLFFLPLFVVEISTFSLLTLSPLTRLSKDTLFSLAGVTHTHENGRSMSYVIANDNCLLHQQLQTRLSAIQF